MSITSSLQATSLETRRLANRPESSPWSTWTGPRPWALIFPLAYGSRRRS